MVNEIRIVFPEFITHARLSKNKLKKIGYNTIHSSAHFSLRDAFVRDMHKYVEQHIPQGLQITGPVQTKIIIHAPINYGNVRAVKDKVTGTPVVKWNPPKEGFEPTWDLFNLGAVWLKTLDDAMIHHKVLPDDNVAHFQGFGGQFIETPTFEERKLIYVIENINYANNKDLLLKIETKHEFYTKLKNKLYRLSHKDSEITEWLEKVENKILTFENQIISLQNGTDGL